MHEEDDSLSANIFITVSSYLSDSVLAGLFRNDAWEYCRRVLVDQSAV
jgi:hypothetical protein